MSEVYWVVGINPEPWAIGSPFRRGPKGLGISPNQKLKAYKAAVAEEFVVQNPTFTGWESLLDVQFHFWRSTEHGNICDATNLQKSTEDALQKVLYANDQSNRAVSSVIVDQGPKVLPAIMIRVARFRPAIYPTPPKPREVTRWADSDWQAPDEEMF